MLGEPPASTDDIYAVGAILYELLSSKPPFFEGDIPAQVRDTTAPFVADRRAELGIVGEAVPRHWEETIAACLAKDPADRPQTPVDLARRLALGGTIRLAVEAQESKVRGLITALFQARVVGAAAGVAALVAAAVIALRPAPSVSVGKAANSTVPGGFATEVRQSAIAPSAAIAKKAALQLSAAPAGTIFAIYPGVVAGTTHPAAPPLHEGSAPESIDQLEPGRYTLFFRNEGWPEERTEIALEPGETLPVSFTFPHGSANITSKLDGAEIFLGTRSLGTAPLTIDLPPGKQELTARYPDETERSQTVTIEPGVSTNVAFQPTSPARPSRGKRKAPASAFEKFSRSLKKFFSPDPPPKRKKG